MCESHQCRRIIVYTVNENVLFQELSKTPASRPVAPPLPSAPPSVSRLTKPAGPPPPPPPQGSRLLVQPSSPYMFSGQQRKRDESPPVPPTRSSSYGSNIMSRFQFIPISELPPPVAFTRTRKIYEFNPSKSKKRPPQTSLTS